MLLLWLRYIVVLLMPIVDQPLQVDGSSLQRSGQVGVQLVVAGGCGGQHAGCAKKQVPWWVTPQANMWQRRAAAASSMVVEPASASHLAAIQI